MLVNSWRANARWARFFKRDMLPDQIGIKGAPCGVS
jgi:hypothetical protein